MDSNRLQTKITKLEKRLKKVEEYIEALNKHVEGTWEVKVLQWWR